jgi:hypothetical protein
VLDEVDELELVHRGDRVRPVVGWRHQVVGAGPEQRLADGRRALRGLEARHLAARQQLDEAGMPQVGIGRDKRRGRQWHRRTIRDRPL